MITLNQLSRRRVSFLKTSKQVFIVLSALVFFLLFSIFQQETAMADGKLRRASNAARKKSAPKKATPPKPAKRQPVSKPAKSKPAKSKPTKPVASSVKPDDHRHEEKEVESSKPRRLAAVSALVRRNRKEDSHDHNESRSQNDSHGHNESRTRSQHDSHRHNESRGSRDSRRDLHRHHGGSRSAGVIFYAPPVTHVSPIVIPVVETCPLDFPQPSYVDSYPVAPISQPIYEPVVERVVVEPVPSIVVAPIATRSWFQDQSSSFWATLGSDFDGITSGGLGLKLQAQSSLGFEASVTTLRESDGDYRDSLWIGDANLMFEAISSENIRGRVGLGVNWLSDSIGAEAGLNLTAGVDLRLTDRLILSAEGDVGNLGDADFFHARVNAARRFDSVDLMLGVDHYNIGGAEINSVFTGIQLRF